MIPKWWKAQTISHDDNGQMMMFTVNHVLESNICTHFWCDWNCIQAIFHIKCATPHANEYDIFYWGEREGEPPNNNRTRWKLKKVKWQTNKQTNDDTTKHQPQKTHLEGQTNNFRHKLDRYRYYYILRMFYLLMFSLYSFARTPQSVCVYLACAFALLASVHFDYCQRTFR